MTEVGGKPLSVTAVVVVWNSATDAIGLVESIERAFENGLRLVLVDNGSTDDSAATLERYLAAKPYRAAATVVRSAENTGFTGGVNFGTDTALAAADPPDYILLLNPDARSTPETVYELAAVAEESRAGIVCNRFRYMTVDAWAKPFWTWRSTHWSDEAPGRWWPIGVYFGTCVLFRSSLVRELIASDGHFHDPGIFIDWEEWDCTLRARKLGSAVVMARDTTVIHDGGPRTLGPGRSSKFRQYYAARNGVAISRRHLPARHFWPLFAVRILRDASWFARLAVRRRGPHVGCYILGTIDAFRGRTGRWDQHPATPSLRPDQQ